jgi:NADP-dependent aldehyde dehydrogenase
MLRESTTPNTKLYNWIHGEEIHVKMSNVMKENWKKDEYRNKKIQGNIDIWKNDEFRSRMSGKNHWISKAYEEKKSAALAQEAVALLSTADGEASNNQGSPTVATASGSTLLKNKLLYQEVFGPYSLVVECANSEEMLAVASSLEGQLTTTIMATEKDIENHSSLVDVLSDKCGRIIMNGVPTGVEVCLSMHHGGPFPSSTDSRFTSVGADAIKRFARPVCYQNFPDHLLPSELQNQNPLGINRRVNDEIKASIIS